MQSFNPGERFENTFSRAEEVTNARKAHIYGKKQCIFFQYLIIIRIFQPQIRKIRILQSGLEKHCCYGKKKSGTRVVRRVCS